MNDSHVGVGRDHSIANEEFDQMRRVAPAGHGQYARGLVHDEKVFVDVEDRRVKRS